MGGQLALYAGSVAPDEIGAVVDMYGIHPNARPDFSKMKAPVLALFAEKDEYVNAEARAALEDDMRQAGVRYEMFTYPGVDHAFMNEERSEVYDAEATEDAYSRILTFFRSNLAG
jgi:carboxymethylenebutenolidase